MFLRLFSLAPTTRITFLRREDRLEAFRPAVIFPVALSASPTQRPVIESFTAATSSGEPLATRRPPPSPPSGPRSMR